MARVRGGESARAFLQSIADKVKRPATLRVGFLEGATYPNGTPVAMIAAVQEFGAPSRGIPPRPFFRRMIAAKEGEWGPAIAALMIEHGYDMPKVMDLAGQGIEGQLRESISSLTDPPLAESTIKQKGHDKPLVESGHLLNSVDHDVKT
jgi:hypothetical protein